MSPNDRPNILLILTEQQRGDCLSCEGHPVLLTPTMDEIGLHGARMSRFYSDCPICMPARRTLMSGQFPATHGILSNAKGVGWRPPCTLAQTLRDHGYQTRWIGRDMHQYPSSQRFGYDEVQSDYQDWLNEHAPADSGGWFGAGIMHNDRTAYPWSLPEYLHDTNWTVTQGLKFLQRRDVTCPYFLTLSFSAAHPPLQPPQPYLDRYIRTGVPDPYIGDWAEQPSFPQAVSSSHVELRGEELLSVRAGYYGLINHLDNQLRRLLNNTAVRQGRDTIVCLTSDHGEMLGDHYLWGKQVAYEGSSRVPFLISAPPSIGIVPKAIFDTPATLADVMPTLLDMVGIDIPECVNGCSLLPLLRGETDFDRQFIHMEVAGQMQAMTDGREKYIWHTSSGREQLFNLNDDPQEICDLALELPTRVDTWRRRLMEKLKGRPEGFTDGVRLFAGLPKVKVIPCDQTPPVNDLSAKEF